MLPSYSLNLDNVVRLNIEFVFQCYLNAHWCYYLGPLSLISHISTIITAAIGNNIIYYNFWKQSTQNYGFNIFVLLTSVTPTKICDGHSSYFCRSVGLHVDTITF